MALFLVCRFTQRVLSSTDNSFQIRLVVTEVQDDEKEYYGCTFHVTEEQRKAARKLHGALQACIVDPKDASATIPNKAMKKATKQLHRLAVSVLFTRSEEPTMTSYQTAWGVTLAYGMVEKKKKKVVLPTAGKASVWFSHMRFVMKIVASREVHNIWKTHGEELGRDVCEEYVVILALHAVPRH